MTPSILEICLMYKAAMQEYCSTADPDRLKVADKWMRVTYDEIYRVDRFRHDIAHLRFGDDI